MVLHRAWQHAVLAIVPVFHFVCVVQQDIANSSGRMREAARALSEIRGGGPVTAEDLISWELKQLGIPRMRKDQKSGVRGMLWMQRALEFVFTLICNMFGTMKTATAKECALDAYDRILKPYHSKQKQTSHGTRAYLSIAFSLPSVEYPGVFKLVRAELVFTDGDWSQHSIRIF